MITLQQQLRDADPLVFESPMSRDDIDRMRLTILAVAADAPVVRVPWLAVAATTLAVVAGIFVTRGEPVGLARMEPRAADAGAAGMSLRQLQFATPGGTRVIWMFNPELELR